MTPEKYHGCNRKADTTNLDLGDPNLCQAIRHAAIERNQPVRAIVVEALRKWLEEQEDQEDIEAIRARRSEETYPWEQVKAEMPTADS